MNHQTHTETPILLSLAQACTTLGVSRTTLWRMTKRGDLAVVHIGTRALIPRASLEQFVSSL
jgi:excisionase family DNA binding protein